MNNLTENNLFCLTQDRNSGKQGTACPLHFEFIVGNVTPVPEGHSTLWRKMPFHLCCVAPAMPEGASVSFYFENQEAITCTAPSVIFIPAGVTHRLDDHGPARESIWIHFRLLFMPDQDLFSLYNVQPFITTEHLAEIETLLRKIIAFPSKLDTVQAAWFQLYGQTLCCKLMERAGLDPAHDTAPQISSEYKKLLPALNLLYRSDRKPSLQELAAAVHLSISRFQTLFRQEMKTTPGNLFRKIQFTRACRLLTDPGLTLAECAEQLGFSDAFHFSREFRKLSGFPPSEYRKQFCNKKTVDSL